MVFFLSTCKSTWCQCILSASTKMIYVSLDRLKSIINIPFNFNVKFICFGSIHTFRSLPFFFFSFFCVQTDFSPVIVTKWQKKESFYFLLFFRSKDTKSLFTMILLLWLGRKKSIRFSSGLPLSLSYCFVVVLFLFVLWSAICEMAKWMTQPSFAIWCFVLLITNFFHQCSLKRSIKSLRFVSSLWDSKTVLFSLPPKLMGTNFVKNWCATRTKW